MNDIGVICRKSTHPPFFDEFSKGLSLDGGRRAEQECSDIQRARADSCRVSISPSRWAPICLPSRTDGEVRLSRIPVDLEVTDGAAQLTGFS